MTVAGEGREEVPHPLEYGPAHVRQDVAVLIVRATKKLLNRVGPPALSDGDQDTTRLGPWYATALFWQPQAALLVNEATLLPVLMPLASAKTLPDRIGGHIAATLTAHGAPQLFVSNELSQMRDCRLGTTASRSVVGVMNEFVRLATIYRDNASGMELLDLALRLAATPCGPLYGRNVSPDRELAALLHTLIVA